MIKLEKPKTDIILPDQLCQFVFCTLGDVAKEVDCSLGLCGPERVGTCKLGNILVGLSAHHTLCNCTPLQDFHKEHN